MKTDELINVLTHTGPSAPRLSLQLAALLIAVVFCALTGLVLGYRPDIIVAMDALPPSFTLKTAFFVAFLLVACIGLRRESTPLGGGQLGALLFIILMTILLAAVAVEAATTPLRLMLAELVTLNVKICLLSVTIYSAIGAVVMVFVLRSFAPANVEKAALWAGLTAAGAGALGYSLHCQSDSPFFILLAYGAPCLLVASLTGLIAPRFLKW